MDDMNINDYTETVSVRLTKEQVAQFKHTAESRNLSQSDVIRQWIENADIIPNIPTGVYEKLRMIARGRRGQTPAKLIENVLKKEWEGRLGWH